MSAPFFRFCHVSKSQVLFLFLSLSDCHEQSESSVENLQSFSQLALQWRPGAQAAGTHTHQTHIAQRSSHWLTDCNQTHNLPLWLKHSDSVSRVSRWMLWLQAKCGRLISHGLRLKLVPPGLLQTFRFRFRIQKPVNSLKRVFKAAAHVWTGTWKRHAEINIKYI